MPIATFRGEKTVADIADKMYTRLTPTQREKATAELIRANPQLKELSTVPKGAVLRIPTLKDIRPKTNRNLENPDVQLAESVSDALSAFSKRFETHLESALDEVKAQQAEFKKAPIKRVIDADPTLKGQADKATDALSERAKQIKVRQTDVSAALRSAVAQLKGKPRK